MHEELACTAGEAKNLPQHSKDTDAKLFRGFLAPQRHKLGRALQQSWGAQTPSATFPSEKHNEGSAEKDLLPPQAGKWGKVAANFSTLGLTQLSQAKSIIQGWAHLLS